MSFSANKAIILGNLGRDPELRYTQSGKAVVNFSVATSERRGDEETTEWHSVVAWDKLAELVNRLCVKGTKVYVEGRIQTREYTDRDDNKRHKTEIVAREMVFLTNASDAPKRDDQQQPAPKQGDGGWGDDDLDSGLPF